MRLSTVPSKILGIDTRSLAAFRIGIGLLLLVDLLLRARDLEAHYTDRGILPLNVFEQLIENSGFWSLHSLHGSFEFQLLMFALAGLFALAYLIGYRTRCAAFLSWVLLLSLQSRNPYIVNGGDVLFRMLLFWSIFLPLDRHWSVASKPASAKPPSIITNMASAAILLQVALLYLMAGYFKLRGQWHDQDILLRIFESDIYAKPLAHYLAGFPSLLAFASWVTLASELIFPILVFCPLGTRAIRLLACTWFLLFHLGIELTLTVGLFSFASCVAWILFLPSTTWNRITRIPSAESNPDHKPQPVSGWCAWVTQSFVALCFAFVLWVNLTSMHEPWIRSLRTDWVKQVAQATGLRQGWKLFARPLSKDGWFIGVARLANGNTVDLFRDGKPADWESYNKPRYVSQQFPNHRWRKYFCRILTPTRVNLRDPLSRYFIQNWNDRHDADEQIEAFELHFMQELGPDEEGIDRYRQRFYSDIKVSESDQT